VVSDFEVPAKNPPREWQELQIHHTSVVVLKFGYADLVAGVH
jgi:hypothetical protein